MAPKTLPTRRLGKDGPQVTAMGFGLLGLSTFYGEVGSDEERFKVLDRAYEIGALNWDSADMYGDSEDLIGKWFKRTGKRNEIFLATKFACKYNAATHELDIFNSPAYVREAFALSVARLGVDVVDLYYCHRFNGEVPVEDVVGAMAELVQAGKVRYLGLSECSATTLRRAHAVHPIACVQVEYSPFSLDIERAPVDLLRTARELGVAVVAYSPLSRGFLSGTVRSRDDLEASDVRRRMPRFSEANFPANLRLVEQLDALAAAKGCTTSQLVLAWLMAQGPDIIPIPGTKKIKYLEENMASLDVVLSPEEEAQIRAATNSADVKGHRYPERLHAQQYRDTPEKL